MKKAILKNSRQMYFWIEAFEFCDCCNTVGKLLGQYRTPDGFKEQYPDMEFINHTIYQ